MLKTAPEVLVLAKEPVQFCSSKAGESVLTPEASYFSLSFP